MGSAWQAESKLTHNGICIIGFCVDNGSTEVNMISVGLVSPVLQERVYNIVQFWAPTLFFLGLALTRCDHHHHLGQFVSNYLTLLSQHTKRVKF